MASNIFTHIRRGLYEKVYDCIVKEKINVNDRDEDEGTEESDQDDEDGDQHDQDSNEVSEYSGTKEFVDHIHDNSSSKATNDVQEQDQVIWIQHYLLIIQRCLNAG